MPFDGKFDEERQFRFFVSKWISVAPINWLFSTTLRHVLLVERDDCTGGTPLTLAMPPTFAVSLWSAADVRAVAGNNDPCAKYGAYKKKQAVSLLRYEAFQTLLFEIWNKEYATPAPLATPSPIWCLRRVQEINSQSGVRGCPFSFVVRIWRTAPEYETVCHFCSMEC
jgi:hypothetical protein